MASAVVDGTAQPGRRPACGLLLERSGLLFATVGELLDGRKRGGARGSAAADEDAPYEESKEQDADTRTDDDDSDDTAGGKLVAAPTGIPGRKARPKRA